MSLILFTDFGSSDLYVGQVKAVLQCDAPGVPVIDLLHDVPNYDIEAGAHLLAALAPTAVPGDVFFSVVDPGVGGARAATAMLADEKWYVGPDNGLLSIVAQRARAVRLWHISWRPQRLSASFHGRDLFAPIAAAIARTDFPHHKLVEVPGLDVLLAPAALQRVIYVDHYGNCMTGIPATALGRDAVIECGNVRLTRVRTFSEAEPGRPFWYENSIGLAEIALNQDSAADVLRLRVGTPLRVF